MNSTDMNSSEMNNSEMTAARPLAATPAIRFDEMTQSHFHGIPIALQVSGEASGAPGRGDGPFVQSSAPWPLRSITGRSVRPAQPI
jgi:hypothetical protein